MKMILIRHGQTKGNAEKRFNGGRTDDPLNEIGRAELQAVPNTEPESLLVTSPMRRAVETAGILFPGRQGIILENLRELDFGKMDGKNHAELDGDPEYQAWIDSGGTMAAPGGESLMSFRERTMRGLREAVRLTRAKNADTLYVVAHGGTIMAGMSALTGKPYYDFLVANGEGYVVELEVKEEAHGEIQLSSISYDRFSDGVRPGAQRGGSLWTSASCEDDRKVVIFSGTTEGRRLSEGLAALGIPHLVSVATEYGEMVMKEHPLAEIRRGRIGKEEMTELLRSAEIVYDATHPYATEVTANIRSAAEKSRTAYVRVIRESDAPARAEGSEGASADVRFFDSAKACAEALSETEGNILLTTGSKELATYAEDPLLRKRLYARVLPSEESIRLCREAGLSGSQILALHGPFSMELNLAILRQYQIDLLVTKESGKTGGYREKIDAAREAGIPVFVIRRPSVEEGLTVEEILNGLAEKNTVEEILNGLAEKKEGVLDDRYLRVDLVGIGPGRSTLLTGEARDAIDQAEILFGARRVIEEWEGREVYPYYRAEDIIPVLDRRHPHRVAILFSGDTGFYSGARSVRPDIDEWLSSRGVRYDLKVHPGISSYAYFVSQTAVDYTDAALVSIHGTSKDHLSIANLLRAVRTYEKVFVLLSGVRDVHLLGNLLPANGLSHCEVMLGYQLSYPDERIFRLTPAECLEVQEQGLYIAFIRNPSVRTRKIIPMLADEAFLRDRVPMTKEMIRHASILRLALEEGDVVYDIGSGTGSVAVEIAGLDESLTVYAVEQKEEAVSLILRNAAKHRSTNLLVIEGSAPEVLEGGEAIVRSVRDHGDTPSARPLPIPDKVFIGGSGGNLRKISDWIYRNNPNAWVVLNAVTLETISEVESILREFPVTDTVIEQIALSRARTLGSYHLMSAENPVWIVSFRFVNGSDADEAGC